MTPDAPRPGIDVSVIVPVYLHWDLVPKLLASLSGQTFAGDRFEIIVVNNSSDAPPPLSLPQNAQITQCLTPGSYAARNAGVAVSRGRWLAFTDADCQPEPGWLDALLAACRGRGGQLLAGRVRMVTDSAHPTMPECYELVRGIPQDRHVQRGYAATANLAVERAVFDAVGGFNPARLSGGDAEFCRRAGAAGYPLNYVGEAVVRHPARASWAEVVTRSRRIKGGQVGAGSPRQRAAWLLRSLTPPFGGIWRALRPRSREYSLGVRLAASAVYVVLWLVGIVEAFRLVVLRRPAERR